MEALLIKLPFSTFSLPSCPSSLKKGNYLTRNSTNLTAKRMPVSNLHGIHKNWNVKQKFELSASANEKNFLENELSTKLEDSNAIVLKKKWEAFCHLCRPYTMIASVGAISLICLQPLQSLTDLSPKFIIEWSKAIAVGLLNTIYINGANQLFDIEIDKVNKGYLPLASGDFSIGEVVAITLSAIILSFGLGVMFKSPSLLCAAAASFIFGTGYSANFPFLRWKRHYALYIPFQAIWFAFGLQIPFFMHIQKYVLGRPNIISKVFLFHTMRICLSAIPQMMLKDIPDTKGDRKNGIHTVSTQLGEEKAFSVATNFQLAVHGLITVVGTSLLSWPGKLVFAFGQTALALVIWNRIRCTDPTNPSSAQSFYMFYFDLGFFGALLCQIVR